VHSGRTLPIGAGVTAVAVALVVAAALVRPARRLVVDGPSMRPTFEPGDRLVAVRLFWRAPRPGDLLAVRDPRDPRRLLVKRAVTVGPAGIEVRGDDPARSTDSRAFGLVARRDVMGLVVHRYGPPGRTPLSSLARSTIA
jgi:nickel-type superoxide dismutase maturation protease